MRARSPMYALLVVAACAFIGAGVLAVNLLGDDGAETSASANPRCESTHAGHNTMMWNPVQADEMLDAGCGWPYDPFLTDVDGGTEDETIDAPFEPRRYSEIGTALTEQSIATCAVASLPDPPTPGYVFGFGYQVAEPTCPTGAAVDLQIREYSSRGHRDAAFRAPVDAASSKVVLGRWVITMTTIDPTKDEMREQLVDALVELGGFRSA